MIDGLGTRQEPALILPGLFLELAPTLPPSTFNLIAKICSGIPADKDLDQLTKTILASKDPALHFIAAWPNFSHSRRPNAVRMFLVEKLEKILTAREEGDFPLLRFLLHVVFLSACR